MTPPNNFENLVFDGRSFDHVSALDMFTAFNCIQIKNVIKPDLLKNELAQFKAGSLRSDRRQPGYGLLNSIDHDPFDLNLDIINIFHDERVFTLVSQILNTDELIIPNHYGSNIRNVRAVKPNDRGDYYADLSVQPVHQDSLPHNIYQFDEMLVVWVLISPERAGPHSAPGLTLYPGPLQEILGQEENPSHSHPNVRGLEIDKEIIEKLALEHGRWIPEIELGDVILFSGYCPHATFLDEGMNRNRLSVEFKVFSNINWISENYFNNPTVDRNYFVVTPRFSVGPVSVAGIKGRSKWVPPSHSRFGTVRQFDFDFLYGRLKNDRNYMVHDSNKKKEPPQSPQKPITLFNIPNNSIWRMAELFTPDNTHRKIITEALETEINEEEIANAILIGNKTFGIHKKLGQEVDYVTFLRNPMTSFIESLQLTSSDLDLKKLEERVDQAHSLSNLPRYLGNFSQDLPEYFYVDAHPKNFNEATETDNLIQAKANIEKYFSFIGVEDVFAETVFLICAQYGWKTVGLPLYLDPISYNETASKIPNFLRRKIEEKLSTDFEIYEFCRAKILKKIAACDFGPEIDLYKKDLDKFRKIMASIALKVGETQSLNDLWERELELIRREKSFQTLNDSLARERETLEKRVRDMETMNELLKEKIERMEESYAQLLRSTIDSSN